MEPNWLNRRVKNLIIGDFVIACYKKSTDIRFEIPFAGMAFYQPGEQEADFKLMIDTVEPDDSGKLLFGSSDYRIPTFLYQRSNGSYNWLTRQDHDLALSYHISNDWTEFTLYEDETGSKGERAFYEFGSLFCYAVLNRQACVLHGVVMEYNGMGILVTAASGTGKTTHTRMWRNHENALILNGDRCLCRCIEGTWYAYGMPWSGSSGEYINRRVPISVIVSLKQSETNYVRKMDLFESNIYLMQRIFAPVWTGELQTKAFDLIGDMAEKILMLELNCRPDLESVQVLKDAIIKEVNHG